MARARKNPIFHLDGADELNKALRSMSDRAAGHIVKDAAQAGAEVIAAEAKVLAPKDEGDLAAGITTKPGRLQQGRAQINIGIGKEWYGELQELGTEKMAAQPFLRPSFDTQKDNAIKAVRDVLKRLLK